MSFYRLLLGLATAIVLFNTGLYLWRARVLRSLPPCDAVERLGLIDALWAFLVECVALAAWLLLIPVGWCLPRSRRGPGTRGAVVLLHGWGLNAASVWLLQRRLLRDGWSPVCSFTYPTFRADLDGAAKRLRDWLEHAALSGPLTLVGHSLGGLVLRYFARRYSVPQVRRIVTLGTPHFGTVLAASPGSPVQHLAPGSPVLNKLNAVDHVPQQFDVIAIQSTFDAMLLPPDHGRYPGAFNIQVNDVGHNALLLSRKVYRLIAENLATPLR